MVILLKYGSIQLRCYVERLDISWYGLRQTLCIGYLHSHVNFMNGSNQTVCNTYNTCKLYKEDRTHIVIRIRCRPYPCTINIVEFLLDYDSPICLLHKYE